MSFVKFALIVVLSYTFMYYVGAVFAYEIGMDEYQPPSEDALTHLQDPYRAGHQLNILLAQLARGLLITVALFPLRGALHAMGVWKGGLIVGGITFIAGYVAATTGLIDSMIYFKRENLPFGYVNIRFWETALALLPTGVLVVALDKRFNKPVPENLNQKADTAAT